MITEDYVSFETAKLLKERGFKGICNKCYGMKSHTFYSDMRSNDDDSMYAAPTQQMAMKWLREVHRIYIDITYLDYLEVGEIWSTKIVEMKTLKETKIEDVEYSYEEAAEEAIKYCLENLI